jgi:hypothetical protein
LQNPQNNILMSAASNWVAAGKQASWLLSHFSLEVLIVL